MPAIRSRASAALTPSASRTAAGWSSPVAASSSGAEASRIRHSGTGVSAWTRNPEAIHMRPDSGFEASPRPGMTALSFSAILLPLLFSRKPRVPFILAILILFCGLVPPCAAQNAALERGTAIIDPLVLRELDRGSFGLGRMLGFTTDAAISNDELFALPSMAPVRQALDEEFERYIAKHRAASPAEAIG